MKFKRIFIEKKEEFNTEAKLLKKDFKDYLEIKELTNLRVLNVYELIGVSEDEKDLIVEQILFESPIDKKYENEITLKENEKAFRVEYLKGQYNQREDSTNKLIKTLLVKEDIVALNSKIIILENVTNEELNKIKDYYINPIEMREVDLDSFHYEKELPTKKEVEIVEGFINMAEDEIKSFKSKSGIGMDMEDLLFCQEYFKNKEKRDPSILELKLIDTYWSDHCRHTTFMSEITDLTIDEGKYQKVFEKAVEEYIESREFVYGERERVVSLMDLATINQKETKKKGLLDDKEDSEEVNAASIEIDVDVDGKTERWLLMFKNETHNHPTEMEPFGGAATCLGGAIRDPLSGRSYVYQAMRITGSADPRQKYEETLDGKLPQRKITRTAKDGYSSYGYQIGAATGYVREVYDPGYLAKRMEVGALVAAAPKDFVYRGKAEPGDVIVLVGGRTGRDGLGGAVGSSREHTEESLDTSGAEVQKGNPPVERKILRLFRKKEVSKMIKICNDFGAGGVSVAIGELADGVRIDLDKIPLKYEGLDGKEIALSESQERMAVVIEREDLDRFMELAKEEDVESTVVADVTEKNILEMVWRGKSIVKIKREFLDTNGIRKQAKVNIENPKGKSYLKQDPEHIEGKNIKDDFIKNMMDLNTASQEGLIEGFDHSVGQGSVLMPLGGRNKITPAEGMAAKIPVLKGNTTTCSLMTHGFDPNLSKWSPFHGGYYAVIESLARIVAMGGDYKNARLSLQEYFERIGEDESKWGKPFAALLGAYLVQKELDTPAIGGKDSMSGTFEDLHVPPTLISFAVGTSSVENIISPEFKNQESEVGIVKLNIDENSMIDFKELKKNYDEINKLVKEGKIISASTVKFGGIGRSIAEMSFGNNIGFEFNDIDENELFKPLYGSIIIELREGLESKDLFKDISYEILGKTISDEEIKISGESIEIDSLIKSYKEPLKEIFPVRNKEKLEKKNLDYNKGPKISNKIKIAKPKVFIPIFTGSHGEYDMAKLFEEAGGQVDSFVFKSLTLKDMEESFLEMAKRIKNSQIVGLPNGSIIGNEPETGGKLMKLIFNNPYIKEAINNHINNKDGLILGVGAGLEALIKTGIIEYGEIKNISEKSPYISYNDRVEFISTHMDIRVSSNLSPWFGEMKLGDKYTSPMATKEGRIIGENLDKLIEKGQVASQFIGENPTSSTYAIESLTSPNGRALGTITSIDRVGKDLYKNIKKQGKHRIFESGINYYK